MTPPQALSFGALLKRSRRAAGLTQGQLAERAGYSAIFISLLECGQRRPVPNTVELLAAALELAGDERALLLEAARTYQPGSSAPTPGEVGLIEGAQLPVGGFLGARPDGPLVAREAELAAALASLDALASGAGRCVLLAGEAGIGKTRLAQEVDRQARERGVLVITGRCYATQQAVALAPFFEALTAAYAGAPQRLRAALPSRWPHVARLVLDVAAIGDAPAPRADTPDEQQRLFWQVTDFVRALAAERPVALLVDDLHWADGASIALLAHLARHTRGDRILLLGTHRDEASWGQPAETPLADLMRERLVERIEVGRLTRSGTEALLLTTLGGAEGIKRAEIAPELVDLLHARTDGVPFFIQEIVRALAQRGDIAQTNGRWEGRQLDLSELPDSVRTVVGQRLAQLSQTAREVLFDASVLGQTFLFTELARLQELTPVAWEMALDEAVTTGLLRETGVEQYTFHHALLQQVLYAGVPARRKRRLHQAAGEALEALPEQERTRRAAELAAHFLRADAGARALPYLLLAGGQAEAVYAHAEAEQHYRQALELAQVLGDQAAEAGALERLGDLLAGGARYDAARSAYTHALALGDGAARDSIQWARLSLKMGNTFNAQKRVEEADAAYGRAEVELEGHATGRTEAWWRVWLGIQLDRIAMEYWQSHLPEMAALVERARPVIEPHGTPRQRAEYYRDLLLLGLRRDLFVPSNETLAHARTALAAAQEAGVLSVVADTQFALGFVELWRGELDAAEEHLRGALALVERTPAAGPFGDLATVCHTYLACLARRRGAVDEARGCAERGMAAATKHQMAVYIGMAQANLAWVAWREGHHDEAETQGNMALDEWRARGLAYPFRWAAHWPLLGVARARGRIGDAIAHARELSAPVQQPLPAPLRALVDQAAQAWDAGQPEAAASYLDAALAAAREAGYA
jgi:eukaryotic-like serine/threonine-protein kinase